MNQFTALFKRVSSLYIPPWKWHQVMKCKQLQWICRYLRRAKINGRFVSLVRFIFTSWPAFRNRKQCWIYRRQILMICVTWASLSPRRGPLWCSAAVSFETSQCRFQQLPLNPVAAVATLHSHLLFFFLVLVSQVQPLRECSRSVGSELWAENEKIILVFYFWRCSFEANGEKINKTFMGNSTCCYLITLFWSSVLSILQ